MNCNHFCNEPFRCPTCTRQFYAWAQARTNTPPKPGRPNFYTAVNNIAPPVQVTQEVAQ